MSNMPYDTLSAPIGAGFFDQNAFKRKAQLILVLKTGLAGIHHRANEFADGPDAFYEMIGELNPGTELKLYREPNNIHDKWAVNVVTEDDIELGYITRFKNETIARLMDEGKKFVAYVDEKPDKITDPTEKRRTQTPTEDFRIPLAVYMEE